MENLELVEVYSVGVNEVDAQLYAFEFNGDMIWNTLLSECGRFAVDAQYYGLTAEQSAGLIARNRAIVPDCI